MTFKKINKTGQSIFEYLILTTAVLAVVLFFAGTSHFDKVKNDCMVAVEGAKLSIPGVETGNTIVP